MKKFTGLVMILMLGCISFAFGQEVPPSVGDQIKGIWELVIGLKGLSGMALASGIIFLLVGLSKVSILAPYWDKLGKAKTFVAPALALLGAILGVFTLEGGFTWANMGAVLMTGAGALAISNIFDSVKAIPGVGSVILSIISLIEKVLLKPKK